MQISKEKKDLKVVLILDTLAKAGTQIQAAMLARELARLQARVTVILLEHPEGMPVPRLPQVEVRSVPVGRLNSLRVAGQLGHLVGVLQQLDPDVVHTFLFKANLIGALAARLAGVPVVVGSRRSLGYDLNRRRALLARLGNVLVDGVVANARCVVEAARRVEGAPLPCPAVIPNGVAPLADPGHIGPRDTLNVGILANIRPVKGHDIALRAFALVAGEIPGARLHLMGDRKGDPRWTTAIDSLIGELDLGDRIVWHDPGSPVGWFFAELDLVVSSSRSEGLSNAILEAMMAGVPVVATDVGGNGEALGDAGTLVAPEDPQALGEAIIRHLRDPNLGVRNARRALQRADLNFNPGVMAARHAGWYRWLLESGSGLIGWLPGLRPRRRVVIAIDQLDTGGTERQLGIWVRGLRERNIPVTVLCLRSGGRVAEELAGAGTDVRVLGKKHRFDPLFLLRQQWLLLRLRPRTVLALLTTAGIWSVPAARLAAVPHVLFSMRATTLTDDPQLEGPVGLLRWSLRLTAAVVGNSAEVLEYCRTRLQVPAEKNLLLPNIIESQGLAGEPRAEVRRRLGLPDATPLVGIVARLVPVKDHRLFLAAFAELLATAPAARALIVGDGPLEEELAARIEAMGLKGKAILMGHRNDALHITRALDVLMLTSHSEGSPNAVLEALAVGTPVVSVDVGDVRSLVAGGGGLVVDSREPAALAAALRDVTGMVPQTETGAAGQADQADELLDVFCRLIAFPRQPNLLPAATEVLA